MRDPDEKEYDMAAIEKAVREETAKQAKLAKQRGGMSRRQRRALQRAEARKK